MLRVFANLKIPLVFSEEKTVETYKPENLHSPQNVRDPRRINVQRCPYDSITEYQRPRVNNASTPAATYFLQKVVTLLISTGVSGGTLTRVQDPDRNHREVFILTFFFSFS